MIKKLAPDLVMCGPAFNFLDYAAMCGQVADDIKRTICVPAIAAMWGNETWPGISPRKNF